MRFSIVWIPTKTFSTAAYSCKVYLEQIWGLMDGGADMLIFETVADSLNAKAAIYALEIYYEQNKKVLNFVK